MVRTRATKGLILRATCRLVAHQIRISATDTRRTGSLVGIDHDMVLGSLLHDIEIVVVHRLRIVVIATWDDVAHIARLHSIVAVFVQPYLFISLKASSM